LELLHIQNLWLAGSGCAAAVVSKGQVVPSIQINGINETAKYPVRH